VAHVWLATSGGDCLVKADQIYDITCVGKTSVGLRRAQLLGRLTGRPRPQERHLGLGIRPGGGMRAFSSELTGCVVSHVSSLLWLSATWT
jgi:hypothetical protein